MRRAPLLLFLPWIVAVAPAPEAMDVEREIALGIPPQPPRASTLFTRARPYRGDTFVGMLLCRVDVVGNGWDGGDPSGPVRRLAGRPEVDLEVSIGEGTRPLRYFGPEDTPSVTFAVPGASIASNTKAIFVVEDRDVVRNDAVGRVELVYRGELPVRGEAPGVRVECRGATERDLEAGVGAAARALETALAPLAAIPEADPEAVDFGFDHGADATARAAAYDLARWAGLGDARVTAAIARLDERTRVWQQRAGAVVTSLRGSARPTDVPFRLPGTTIDARVGPQACDADSRFDFRNAGRVALRCGIPIAIEESESTRPPAIVFHAIDARGTFTPIDIVLVEQNGELVKPRGGRLPAGAQILVLGLVTDGAQLLRIGLPTSAIFVNVARPVR